MTYFIYHGNGDVSIDSAKKAEAFPALLAKAETDFLDQLVFFAGITRDEAATVFAFYKKNRLIKRDSTPAWKVKHGAYFDGATIHEALALAVARAK